VNRYILVLALGTLPGLYAHASNLPEFVQTCSIRGLEKLRIQAEAYGANLQEETFTVCGIDQRWYNPSKYVWYCAKATTHEGAITTIQSLVQYSSGKCF
jgi:hypothetical protein